MTTLPTSEIIVKERPILFSGAMVRALLDGRKTQTRRIVKSKGGELPPAEYVQINQVGAWFHFENTTESAAEHDEHGPCLKMWTVTCPYGQPGDRLWVRETTRSYDMPNIITREPTGNLGGEYVADGEPVLNPQDFDLVWWYSRKSCPAIHMPRFASRLLLEITAVWAERLQSISEADAGAEGVENLFSTKDIAETTPPLPYATPAESGWLNYLWHGNRDVTGRQVDGWPYQYSSYKSAKESYSSLWAKINAPESWAANPWVWVVEFKVINSK